MLLLIRFVVYVRKGNIYIVSNKTFSIKKLCICYYLTFLHKTHIFLCICLQIVYYYTLLYIRPFFWFRSCYSPWFRGVVSSMVPGVLSSRVPVVLSSLDPVVLSSMVPGVVSSRVPGMLSFRVPRRDLLPGAPSAYMQPSDMRGRIEGVQRGGQSRVRIEGVGIVFKMRLL